MQRINDQHVSLSKWSRYTEHSNTMLAWDTGDEDEDRIRKLQMAYSVSKHARLQWL